VLDEETQDLIADAIEEFITGTIHRPEPERVLATVMFIDIVQSTEHASAIGDERWRELLKKYYEVVGKDLATFRGRQLSTAGDGVLATFDGPARAIRCACSIRKKLLALGIRVRTGLHTGECELIGDDVGGIAIHIASRVESAADPDEVLVSSTVKDLVAGSGIQFADRGMHSLKGVPDQWRLFTVQ
jgi:class 3 adenylate cyclase